MWASALTWKLRCNACLLFFQAEEGIRDGTVTGVQTCALPISYARSMSSQAKAEREDMLRAYAAEIGAMIDAWDSARERRGRYRSSIVPLAADRSVAARAARSEERRVGKEGG